jgi:PAS domain S-box-containing protein
MALEPVVGARLLLLTFFPAVALAAWCGGVRPGLVTTIVCAVASAYFAFSPSSAWLLPQTDVVALVLFVAIGVLLSSLYETLHRRRRQIVALVDNALDAVVLADDAGRIISWNPRAEQLFGWSRDEIVGKALADTIVPPALRDAHRRGIERYLATGEARVLNRLIELPALRRDGTEIPVEIAITPVQLGTTTLFSAFLRDISERKQGETSARRLAAIVESSDDAIIGATLDGTITSWNGAAVRMYGHSEAEAVGQTLALIVPPDRLDEEAEVLRRLTRGETLEHFETTRIRKDGQRVDISLTVSPIRDAAGTIVGISKTARDISERRRAEAERSASLAREHAARAEAEAANRAKDEFLAVLSHELRTPLNAVYGWARMLRSGQVSDEGAQRAVDAIVRNANAQVQLIDDLLDVSRIITGKMRLAVRPVDLKSVVESALETVRPAAELKAIRLHGMLDPRAAPITGDPDRLQQVVWNLLMNAVKFTPKGGQVQVQLRRINSHVEIVVSNTGQGIESDMLPVIFERFRQGDSSSTRMHTGLGLGLALVKHLVELHGGTVVAQSAGKDRGATFIVKLPLTLAEIPAGPAARVHPTAAPIEPTAEGPRLDGLRVLVVDDEPDALELASTILSTAGAAVRVSPSAADALAVLPQWRPDVLVSDIEMPEEDGYSLIRKIRALPAQQGGQTPAIALTAYGRTVDRMRTLSAGYNMHVPKPVDPGELRTIVASVATARR